MNVLFSGTPEIYQKMSDIAHKPVCTRLSLYDCRNIGSETEAVKYTQSYG